MSEEIKAAHAMLEASENQGVFYWKCLCGAAGDGDVSPGAAVDGHAEHAQESGEYGLPGGFVVVESLHGEACAGCRKEARSAAIHARMMGSIGATHSTTKPNDPWEDPEVDHSARVERPKGQG